jgi:hypothetical protein
MWDGDTRQDDNLIFAIVKEKGNKYALKMRGNGEFTGKIFAQDGGNIAGWKIASDCLVKYGKDGNGNDKTSLDSTLANDQAFI